MQAIRIKRAAALAIGLTVVFGQGLAVGGGSEKLRDTQDFALANMSAQLDACVRVDANAAFIAGDLLKAPLSGGRPVSWSDLTVTLWLRDDCASTVKELTGFAYAPPDITRLERATATDIVVTVVDPTGTLEADVTVTFDWTVAGPATSVRYRNAGYYREERIAPADVAGGLRVTDPDGDVWPGGFGLGQSTITDAWIGFANEIMTCCS